MTRLLALVLLGATAAPVAAQWSWRADLDASVAHRANLFRAPDRLVVGPTALGADSLVRSDMVTPVRASVEIGREVGPVELELDLTGEIERYATRRSLDGGFADAELEATAALGRRVEASAMGGLRASRSVGTDVLGDELTRLFSYRQREAAGALEWSPRRRRGRAHEVALDVRVRDRDYAETDGQPSLDWADQTARLGWTYEAKQREGRRWRDGWEVGAGVRVRDKRYRAYAAQSAAGESVAGAPLHRLRFLSVDAEAGRALGGGLALGAGLELTRRTDPFEGYYSYRAVRAEGEARYEGPGGLDVRARAGWRRVAYATREAPQAEGAPPRLRYAYLTWDLRAERPLGRAVTLGAFAESADRLSNVTDEAFATRRSYATGQAGLTLTVELDKLGR